MKKYHITHLILIQEIEQNNSIPIGMEEIRRSIVDSLNGDVIEIRRPVDSPELPRYLYKAQVIRAVFVRTSTGNETGRTLPIGDIVEVYEEGKFGGWPDRAVIDPVTKDNVWLKNLKRLS